MRNDNQPLPESEERVRSQAGRLYAVLCRLQAVGATAAALAALAEVETIVGSCPAIAALGFAIALRSVRNGSVNLLLLGLLCPLVTAVIALLIAVFAWGPREASQPVPILLVLNAGVTVPWALVTARRIQFAADGISPHASPSASSREPAFRFRIGSLLIAVTVLCVVLAVGRAASVYLSNPDEGVVFGAYGMGVLALSLGICFQFARREELDLPPMEPSSSTLSRRD